MTTTSAQVVADSININGDRLTTMVVTTHRFVLAEFNTHRVFSRNSASSRAIPLEKQLERVKNDPAWPLEWPAEQPGMQGGNELTGGSLLEARELFEDARDAAVSIVSEYIETRDKSSRLHKSYVNRLLEPFMWHTIIVSSTDYDNFFLQRCSPLAQPEIRAAAEVMRDALAASTPVLRAMTWHLPLVSEELRMEISQPKAAHISAARCARVSTLNHDGSEDVEKDLGLYIKLRTATPPHWSPLEHPALPSYNARGNFKGWAQLRQIEEESA